MTMNEFEVARQTSLLLAVLVVFDQSKCYSSKDVRLQVSVSAVELQG